MGSLNMGSGLARRLGRFVWNIPRNVLIGVLKAYRMCISPIYGDVCRFFPSCSAYALEAITVHGAVRGTWLALRRLVRCHPWNAGGVDHVPEGKRVFSEGKRPWILQLNHPVLLPDLPEREASAPRPGEARTVRRVPDGRAPDPGTPSSITGC